MSDLTHPAAKPDSAAAPARGAALRIPRPVALWGGALLVLAAATAIFQMYELELLLSVILGASLVAILGAIEAWGFRSLKTGLTIFAVVGVACIYGTMFYAANQTLGDHAIPLAKARVFSAWWFFGLLGLFFVQFVLSTWPVTKMSFKTWGRRDFRRGASGYRPGPRAAAVAVDDPDRAEEVLRRWGTRAHRDGDALFAHRGLRQRWGPTIVHAGIVVILLSGLARVVLDRRGVILSEGRFIANEGEVVDYIYEPRFMDQAISQFNIQQRPIDYQIKVLDFDEIRHPNSLSPAYFSTHLEVRDMATGRTKVAKLDMNHSLRIGGMEFHQASYAPMPDTFWRTNIDVRDAATGARIAVADASPDTRVQVADLDLFLEIDGEEPGAPWRLFTSADPLVPIEEGVLLRREQPEEFAIRPVEFYLNFALRRGVDGVLEPYDDTPLPITSESAFVNPAARVEVLRDGRVDRFAYLFFLEELAREMPEIHPDFEVEFADFRVARKEGPIDLANPDEALLMVRILDRTTGEEVLEQAVGIGMRTTPVRNAVEAVALEPAPEGARFAIYPLDRTTRFTTVLTVTHEPIVPYYIAGVIIIAFGAVMTFASRYRTVHAWFDRERGVLLVSARQRFGEVPQHEFDRLVAELSGGRGPAPWPGTPSPQPQTA